LDRRGRVLRLAFAGTAPFAVPALDALAAGPHELAAVFTRPDSAQGRGRALAASPVKARAVELGLPVHQPVTFRSEEAQQTLRDLCVDLFVVVAYGLILPPAALAIPAQGCLNIHGSLLPRWRGAAPVERALLAGDRETGITVIRMEAGLDTGPMLQQRAIEIGVRETAATLRLRLAALGGELISSTLEAIAAGRSHERPQPPDGVVYAAKIEKTEALIDWRNDAAAIDRKVRAFNPWPVAETRWRSAQLRIWEAVPVPATVPGAADPGAPGTVLSASSDGLLVACGAGTLRILRLQLPGRKPVGAVDFVNAHSPAGARLGSA
jgi:methionyl-tRNA formyltransferase